MNYKKSLILIYFSIIIMMSGCSANPSSKGKSAEKTAQLLGTVITGEAYGDNAEEALNLAFGKVREIDDKMSRHKSDSTVSLINENESKEPVAIDPDTYKVIKSSLDYGKKSGGAFNPLLGEIIELWGIGTEAAKIPDDHILSHLLENINIENIKLTKDPNTALLSKNNIKLDLGAIAKGYAADEMAAVLKDEGIESALLNLGGNIIVIGEREGKDPWNIGIQNPLVGDRGDLAAIIEISDTSAVTSGSYERFFEEDGKRYHHILDPSTGYPANSGIISSTIITPNSMNADALSTAIYVMGKDKGLALIEKLDNTEAIIITDDNIITGTSGIDDSMFELKSKDFIYEKE